MNTGQLEMMVAPAMSLGQAGNSVSLLVSGAPQADGFAGLFAGMVMGNTGTTEQLQDVPVSPGWALGDAMPVVSVDLTREAMLPVVMGGATLHAATHGDKTEGTVSDTAEASDTAEMANSGLPSAMAMQPQIAPPVISQQGDVVTEQNAPSRMFAATGSIESIAADRPSVTAVAATAKVAVPVLAVPDGAQSAFPSVKPETGEPVSSGAFDVPVQQNSQLPTEARKENPVQAGAAGETTAQIAVQNAEIPAAPTQQSSPSLPVAQKGNPAVGEGTVAPPVVETTGQIAVRNSEAANGNVVVIEVKRDLPANSEPVVSKIASSEDVVAVVPEQASRSEVKPVPDTHGKQAVVATATVVPVEDELAVQPAQIQQPKDTSGLQENRPVRSVPVATPAVAHQQAITSGQDALARVAEPEAKSGQALATAVTGVVDTSSPGANDGESGDLGHPSSQAAPQQSHMHVSAGHQQAAFNGAEALTQTTEVANQPEQLKSEQGRIVHQVKEQLSNHEVKQGNDQITLRLSPQNLGDIQVNLRLDNQRLKVEIVAENHTVRDALLQNSDSLKESLARQNISMESFDVTTGGNGGFRQGAQDWKQLAQQRQPNPWMPSGYHVASQEQIVRQMPVYMARQEHAMVDLHF